MGVGIIRAQNVKRFLRLGNLFSSGRLSFAPWGSPGHEGCSERPLSTQSVNNEENRIKATYAVHTEPFERTRFFLSLLLWVLGSKTGVSFFLCSVDSELLAASGSCF